MKFYEYGNINNPVVIYIHGMGCDTLKSYLPNLKEMSWGNVSHDEIMAEKPELYASTLKNYY